MCDSWYANRGRRDFEELPNYRRPSRNWFSSLGTPSYVSIVYIARISTPLKKNLCKAIHIRKNYENVTSIPQISKYANHMITMHAVLMIAFLMRELFIIDPCLGMSETVTVARHCQYMCSLSVLLSAVGTTCTTQIARGVHHQKLFTHVCTCHVY